jgi:hypothetical protein
LTQSPEPGESTRPARGIRSANGSVGGPGGAVLRKIAFILGCAVLALQLGLVAYEHLGSTRYFAWAPNDYVVQYTLHATVDGNPLSATQLRTRYHLAPHGIWYFPAQQIIDDVQQYERTYGARDHVTVNLKYRLDGHAATTWRWSHG